jgi:serine/threonine protein phosphatase PrpC
VLVAGKTDRGREREINEDNYIIHTDSPLKIMAVADGMGGHAAGEIASRLAINVLRKFIEDKKNLTDDLNSEELKKLAIELIHKANDHIIKEGCIHSEFYGMGTTLTLALIKDDILIVGHIGDSRAYLINKTQIRQLTEDHSLVVELVKNGQINKEEAANHPQRHILTRALGTSRLPEPDVYHYSISEEDHLLLCTDGLTSLVEPEELHRAIIEKSENPHLAVDFLIDLANQRGGYDNITVALVSRLGGSVKDADRETS